MRMLLCTSAPKLSTVLARSFERMVGIIGGIVSICWVRRIAENMRSFDLFLRSVCVYLVSWP